MTVCIPSTEIMSLQLVAHWSGALLFGVFYAAAIILFLWSMRKVDKSYVITLAVFCVVLATMIGLLLAFKKNGVIESVPMWSAYIVLFLVNFTPLFPKEKKNNNGEISK